MNFALLCGLCESGNSISHNNWLGYLGFALVAFMLVNDMRRKKKAKQQAEK